MKTKIHATAGIIGFLIIGIFWTSTVLSELFGSYEDIASVKTAILQGMFILIPALMIAGGSGMVMGQRRTDIPAVSKKKRMPFIVANGLLVLVPAAIYLQSKASVGDFDGIFYTIQGVELVAGAANFILMGLNIRDGLAMTRMCRKRKKHVQ
ncbi:hypothetical protein NBZ79_06230 [Sneathiella marina]|uniref:Lipoprotein n=1 Tax=Sneathiella marina TaxID=2950108 RepID=A0ABY4W5U7_9PROT|nr:hypothetical protein [Sneathiella marina]USG62571.1 hypothetical protein NBZ79_06230 [Sneathiella marina]